MECPICGEFNEQDHFTCPQCNRENICGSHYNFDYLVCSDCAKKMAPAAQKPAAKKKAAAPAAAPAEGEDADKSPFYIRKVKCPVCGSSNDQCWFKAKTYSDRDIDVDKHVQSYMWTDKAFQKYHPPLYYIWHCNNCHYADSYLAFENPTKDPFSNFRLLKDAFIDKYHDDPRIQKIVDKLGENIDYSKMNYYQAIKLHMLAIFIQELIDDKEELDHLKIGRYYLRLGWLYRELHEKKEGSEKIINTLVKLAAFLKKGWPEVPDTEVEAMHKAIDMLNEAFKSSQAIKSIVAEVDLLMMIAGIHLKIDETEKGLQILNTVLARGQKTKQKLEIRIKEAEKSGKQVPPEELRQYDLQLKKLGALMTKARDTIGELKAAKMKEDRGKAKAIIRKLGERPPQEIRALLIKKGIDKRVAEELTPEQKKKFLGLF